MKVDS